MSRIMIDTLRFADRLKDSGFESRQAEGMARTLDDELIGTVEHLATKSDLERESGKVSAKVEALDAKVEALGTQIKFVFAALAMLLALGLIDTVPRLLG